MREEAISFWCNPVNGQIHHFFVSFYYKMGCFFVVVVYFFSFLFFFLFTFLPVSMKILY